MTRERSFSLRARVAAAAALGATVIAVILGVLVAQAIERNNVSQTDQQLRVAARLVVLDSDIAVRVLALLGKQNDVALTIQGADPPASTPVRLPDLPDGARSVTVDGVPYRVLTVTDRGRHVSLGLPAREAAERTTQQRRWVIAAGALAVAAAAGLGWVFGGRAVRPIVELTAQVRAGAPIRPRPDVRSPVASLARVREADELAGAVGAMLAEVDRAQAGTAAALATARDFAAAAAHELRTPLTAMRTDLDVLRTLDLDATQRAEILADLQRSQGRVEATLSALERLASGELSSAADHADVDLVELCDSAARDAMRQHPGLTVRVEAEPPLVVRGLPAGLRLTVDNALTNAVRHGRARTAVVSAARTGDRVVLTVDDDGRGVPDDERTAVFERFRRGRGAAAGGSGLGLALVAQQAELHGGSARLESGPLGGARLVIVLADR